MRDVISPWMKKQNSTVFWESKEMTVYSVCRVWETLRNRAPTISWYKLVWGRNCPPRFSLIVWLIMRNAIVIRDKLQKWGKIMDASCPLCGLAVENRDHLFVQCSFSRRLAAALKCQLMLHSDWEAMVSSMILVGNARTRDWHALIWCLLMTFIWKEQCGVTHGSPCRSPEQVAELIRMDLLFISCGNREIQDALVGLGYL
ncbi:unnamed protein product [Linum trigynum]|uniref:Reverse transcriptase zinc-binding domain-containing protein n=1 Tax=Linum trigynum TaxID=586398 RepID=A0AAV2CWJ1_9ROSI